MALVCGLAWHLARVTAARALCLLCRPWKPGRLRSWHLLWQVPLLALGCWRVAEAAAEWWPPAAGAA